MCQLHTTATTARAALGSLARMPVVAVPTSIGHGDSFGSASAVLTIIAGVQVQVLPTLAMVLGVSLCSWQSFFVLHVATQVAI